MVVEFVTVLTFDSMNSEDTMNPMIHVTLWNLVK